MPCLLTTALASVFRDVEKVTYQIMLLLFFLLNSAVLRFIFYKISTELTFLLYSERMKKQFLPNIRLMIYLDGLLMITVLTSHPLVPKTRWPLGLESLDCHQKYCPVLHRPPRKIHVPYTCNRCCQ